ncbi:MAG TPA: family 16 glycosylhydrolase [Armatimonadota bacterium]
MPLRETLCVAALALAACCATIHAAPVPEPTPEQWVDYPTPKGAWTPVKRVQEKLPLSDQGNLGKWRRYAPLWDEFDGSRLDARKWWDHNPTWTGREPAFFAPGNASVGQGELRLTARLQEPPESLRGKGYHTFSTAAVQSRGRVLYGYFEVRAKAMKSHASSAFWFYAQTKPRWTEIDVFEISGGAPTFQRKVFQTVHVFKTPEEERHWQRGSAWEAPWPLADDFHVYGLEWNPREIRYYVDGRLTRKGANTHWHQPLTLNFDSETMPDWFGLPAAADLPSVFRVDYVRAWKQE